MKTFRRVLTAAILIITIGAIAWSARERGLAGRHFRFTQPAMGTVFHVDCFGVPEETASVAVKGAFEKLHAIEASLSRFRESSEISLINAAPEKPFTASGYLADCLRASISAGDRTGGYFDISFMPLYKMWDWRNSPKEPPAPATVAETLKKVGYKKIKFDDKAGTVCMEPGMKIDLGGIAKGYAVGRMAEILKAHGVNDCIVEGGGDLVVTAVRPYVIGIQDPFGPQGVPSARLIVKGPVAVFTSGDYEQYAEIGGKRYGHIIDPLTGYPAEGPKSATIIGSDPAMTDALATALIAMGMDRAKAFAEKEKLPVLLVSPDGEYHSSTALSTAARLEPIGK